MPESTLTFDNEIEEFIKKTNQRHFLDIGAGSGKYGKMIKKNIPDALVETVEIDENYIDTYNLKSIYDNVYNISVEDFVDNNVDYTCDICIIGDCLEHLRKSVGIDLLNFFVYRTKYIIVKYPVRWIQNSYQGHKNEAHCSIWDKADFQSFDYDFFEEGCMRLVIIKGYLNENS